MLTINSNKSSLAVQNLLNNITNSLEATSKRISTGKRINSAADDPAGLAIATRMKSDLGSYGAVKGNISSGVSLVEVANSSLQNATDILGEMKKLVVQSQNDTLSVDQRSSLNTAFVELQDQYQKTIDGAEIFGKNLLAAGSADVDLQVGINAGDKYTLKAADTSAANLGIDAATINISTIADADAALTAIDTAFSDIGISQSVMGAQQNALNARTRSVESLTENIEAARARIEDADMAAETSKLAQFQTKQQAAIAMLGLVNSLPQNALQLLR